MSAKESKMPKALRGYFVTALLVVSVFPLGYWSAAKLADYRDANSVVAQENEIVSDSEPLAEGELVDLEPDENWDSEAHWKQVRDDSDEGDYDEAEPESEISPPQMPTAPPEPTKTTSSAKESLLDYYRFIGADQFQQAYALRSSRSHAQTSYSDFSRTWRDNQKIKPLELTESLKSPGLAVVKGTIEFTDRAADGVVETKPYRVRVKMTQEGDSWRYDGGDFALKPEPYRIDPDLGVGQLRLGRPVSDSVKRTYGPSRYVAAGPSVDSGSISWGENLLVKLNDGRGRQNVFSIFVRDSRFHTVRGVRVGDSLEDLLRAYPQAQRNPDEPMDGDVAYSVRGIGFQLNQGYIYQISLGGF